MGGIESQRSQLQDRIVSQVIDLRATNYMHWKRTHSQKNTPPALESRVRVTSHMTLRLSFLSASSFLSGHHWITELLTKPPTTKFPLRHQPFRHFCILKDESYNTAKMPQEISDIKNVSLLLLFRNVDLEGTMLIENSSLRFADARMLPVRSH
jgi:hypothetical protein